MKAFDRIWAARKTRMIAPPSCVGDRMRASSRGTSPCPRSIPLAAILTTWSLCSPTVIGASPKAARGTFLAYSAAMGGLEQYRGDRDLPWLWDALRDVPTIKWIGRLQSLNLRDSCAPTQKYFPCEQDHLAMQLGHTPHPRGGVRQVL